MAHRAAGRAVGGCPRCGTVLEHGRVGGRSTVWCPRCQAG
ncbi:zinc finger domain-containing protein [Amycolatopsis thermoflava]